MGLKQDSKVISWHFDVAPIFVNKRWQYQEFIPEYGEKNVDEWKGFYTERPFLFTKSNLTGEDLIKEPFLGFDILREIMDRRLYGEWIDVKDDEDFKKEFIRKHGDFDFFNLDDVYYDLKYEGLNWGEFAKDMGWSLDYLRKCMAWHEACDQRHNQILREKSKDIGKFLNLYGDFYGLISLPNGQLSFRNDDPIVQRMYPPYFFGHTAKKSIQTTDRKGYWVNQDDFMFEAISLLLITEVWISITAPDTPSHNPEIPREQYITDLAKEWAMHYQYIFIPDLAGDPERKNQTRLKFLNASHTEVINQSLGTEFHMPAFEVERTHRIPEENKYKLMENIMLFFTQKHITTSSLKAVDTPAGKTIKELVVVKSIGDFYWSNIKYTMLAQQGVSVCQYAKCQKYFLREKSNQNYCLEKSGNDCQVKAKEQRRYERKKQKNG